MQLREYKRIRVNDMVKIVNLDNSGVPSRMHAKLIGFVATVLAFNEGEYVVQVHVGEEVLYLRHYNLEHHKTPGRKKSVAGRCAKKNTIEVNDDVQILNLDDAGIPESEHAAFKGLIGTVDSIRNGEYAVSFGQGSDDPLYLSAHNISLLRKDTSVKD